MGLGTSDGTDSSRHTQGLGFRGYERTERYLEQLGGRRGIIFIMGQGLSMGSVCRLRGLLYQAIAVKGLGSRVWSSLSYSKLNPPPPQKCKRRLIATIFFKYQRRVFVTRMYGRTRCDCKFLSSFKVLACNMLGDIRHFPRQVAVPLSRKRFGASTHTTQSADTTGSARRFDTLTLLSYTIH